MTLGALYRQIKTRFGAAGIETPELDAKLLLSYALGCAPNDVLLKPETPAQTNKVLEDALARRLKHEPVSKIIGTRGFYGFEFEVSRNVLDPRADTETLVDAARIFISSSFRRRPESTLNNDEYKIDGTVDPCLRRDDDIKILDLCTGSGCIALTLLNLFSNIKATATDVSPKALSVAKRNAERLGLSNRVRFLESDWLKNIEGRFDVITCNPPYIPSNDIETLEADVRLYDPLLALNGGADGLVPYRIVFPQIRKFLKKGGVAFFECGAGQAEDIVKIAASCGLEVVSIAKDLAGISRVVCLS
ncbi:MAG: peptide chain release factor N(5)-glutamine methyltransferase [Proteobacteria bacterium]|nr:peptide chain release factor N(5)-glutamine methyltransferase [Pseudomonadota bacterium]